MSTMFKWWTAVAVIANLILIPLLWREQMDVIPQLLMIVGFNAVYFLFGLMGEIGEQINKL